MDASANDPPVAERVGNALTDAGATLATAESCTGGLIGSRITDVPGASDYFDRTYVTYTYDAKLDTGVPREFLDEHGAVSEPVARAMARAVRDDAGATWALSTTGVAGPTGGTEETPVGTVYIGVAHAGEWGSQNSFCEVTRREFDGTRVEIKERIARAALTELEAHL